MRHGAEGGSMRQVFLWTFNAAVALLLVTCIATVGLWYRSSTVLDEINWCDGNEARRFTFRSGGGLLELTHSAGIVYGDPVPTGLSSIPRQSYRNSDEWIRNATW